MNISTIADELKGHIQAYRNENDELYKFHSLLTDAQKEKWPIRNGLRISQLGNDSDNPLVLLKENGYETEPLFAKGYRKVVQHYTQGSDGIKINHLFPPPDGLIRFGIFFHLNLFQILVLLIKNEWERYFLKFWGNWVLRQEPDRLETDDNSFLSCLKGYETALKVDNKFEEFSRFLYGNEDVLNEWRIYMCNYLLLDKYKLSDEHLHILIKDILNQNLFLRNTWSKQVTKYSENQFEFLQVLSEQDLANNDLYWITKGSYQVKEMNLSEILYQIENLKMEHLRIENDWHLKFGEKYFKILSLQIEEKYLNKKLKIRSKKTLEPDLQIVESIDLEFQNEKSKVEENKKQMDDQFWIINYLQCETRIIEGEELVIYERECRDLLRQIYKLTHPDGSMRNFSFTNKQREFLINLFQEAITIRRHDPDFTFGIIQQSRLRRILLDVKALYSSLGEIIESDQEMENATIKEQIKIYERRIIQLELDMNNYQNILLALQSDKNINEKKSQLSSPVSISEFDVLLEKRIIELIATVETLNIQISGFTL